MKRMLKKLMKLFLENKDEIKYSQQQRMSEPELEREQLKHAHAKVAFQYPKGNFRFPVIPDEKKESPSQKKQRHSQNGRQLKSQTTDYNYKITMNDKPFKPTDVPSPIHGFQSTSEKKHVIKVDHEKGDEESEEMNYINHDEESELSQNDKNVVQTILKHDQERILNDLEESEEELKDSEEVQDEIDKKDSTVVGRDVYHHDEGEVVKETNHSSNEKDFAERIESEMSDESDKKHEKQPENKAYKEDHQKGGVIPYNVLMLKQDKQRVSNKRSISQQSGSNYHIPPLQLLDIPPKEEKNDQDWLCEQKKLLDQTLENFNVRAKVVEAVKGPSVTRFEVQPEPGVKVNKITNLTDDIKLSMAAKDIRMEAPIPGKNAI